MFMLVLTLRKHVYGIGLSTGQDPVAVGFKFNRLVNYPLISAVRDKVASRLSGRD